MNEIQVLTNNVDAISIMGLNTDELELIQSLCNNLKVRKGFIFSSQIAVGDTVFVIIKKQQIVRGIVTDIKLTKDYKNENQIRYIVKLDEYTTDSWWTLRRKVWYSNKNIFKKLFLTKEEAEEYFNKHCNRQAT